MCGIRDEAEVGCMFLWIMVTPSDDSLSDRSDSDSPTFFDSLSSFKGKSRLIATFYCNKVRRKGYNFFEVSPIDCHSVMTMTHPIVIITFFDHLSSFKGKSQHSNYRNYRNYYLYQWRLLMVVKENCYCCHFASIVIFVTVAIGHQYYY